MTEPTNEATTATTATTAPPGEPVLLGQLPGGELAYHLHVQRQLLAAQTVWDTWSGFLRQRYEIAPGDRIDEQGQVWKVSREPVAAPGTPPAPTPVTPEEGAHPNGQRRSGKRR